MAIPEHVEAASASCDGAAAEALGGLSERQALVKGDAEPEGASRHPSAQRLRSAVALGLSGLLLALACAAAAARRRGSGFGLSNADGGPLEVPAEFWQQHECFEQLSETYPTDLVDMGRSVAANQGAVSTWLAAASATSDAAEEVGADDARGLADADQAISQMLHMKDPKKAKAFVQKAMARAVNDTIQKRRGLKQFLNTLPEPPPTTLSPRQQVKATVCAFDVIGMLSVVTAMGADINDIAQTCEHVSKVDKLKLGELESEIHTMSCAINIGEIIEQLTGLAVQMIVATNNCAITAESNLDATCAAAIMAMITTATGGSLSAMFVNAACHSPLAGHGYVPSNVGNNKFLDAMIKNSSFKPDEAIAQRRLQEREARGAVAAVEAEKAPSAYPRRLMFGGGKSSLMVSCVTTLLSAVWALAAAGLAINSAGAQNGGSCPPKDMESPGAPPSDDRSYGIPQAACVADVSAILTGFLVTITYIENSLMTCGDVISLDIMCAQAITGVLATMASATSTASAIFLTCDENSRKYLDELKQNQSAGATTNIPPSDVREGTLIARRLHEAGGLAESYVNDVKARFKSPEEAFRSIGFDIADKDAPFHERAKVIAAETKRHTGIMLSKVLAGEEAGDANIAKSCGGS